MFTGLIGKINEKSEVDTKGGYLEMKHTSGFEKGDGLRKRKIASMTQDEGMTC